MRNAQILLITTDNTSNNDKMVEKLGELIDDFPGAANQTLFPTRIKSHGEKYS